MKIIKKNILPFKNPKIKAKTNKYKLSYIYTVKQKNCAVLGDHLLSEENLM